MATKNKKISAVLLALFLVVTAAFFSIKRPVAQAQDLQYVPLISLSTGEKNTNETTNVGAYISNFFLIFEALIVFFAVVQITKGGIKLMMSGDNSSMRSQGKNDIYEALWGLGILISAHLILGAVNPRLVSSDLLDFSKRLTSCSTP